MENHIRKYLALSVVYLKKSCYEVIELKIMLMWLGEAGTAYHSLASVLLVGTKFYTQDKRKNCTLH
jgi:hypothetical protein